jgi:hypothetical protein
MEMTVRVTTDEWLESLLEKPEGIINLSFDDFLQRIVRPLEAAEIISDKARAIAGDWLVWGYNQYAKPKGGSVLAFCKEVRDGLFSMGTERVPSSETLRGWYYTAIKPSSNAIQQEDGFGMASACLLSNDPEGDRANALCAAAKQVASETGMGAVQAARLLKVAYAGHEEQEWADGLPRLTYEETRYNVTLILDSHNRISTKLWMLKAEWRDEKSDVIGFLLPPDSPLAGDKGHIALRHVANLLRLKKASPIPEQKGQLQGGGDDNRPLQAQTDY